MDTKQLITGNPKEGFYPIVQDTVTVIELNETVMNLTSESSSEDIAAAFDTVEGFNELIENVRNSENIVNGILVNNDGAIGKIICTIYAYKNQYACDIEYIYDSKIIRIDITNTDGTLSCVRKETNIDSNLTFDGDGTKFLSDDGTYKTIEAGDKTNVLILSLENDLANGQKDSPVTAEVSTALKDAISTGKACVIKSANSDILANLQQISDNVTIVMEQISRVGQTFVAVNTTITVNTATNVISDYQTGAIVLETEGDGSKFLSDDGTYKEVTSSSVVIPVNLKLNETFSSGGPDGYDFSQIYNAYISGKTVYLKDSSDDLYLVINALSNGVIYYAINTTGTYSGKPALYQFRNNNYGGAVGTAYEIDIINDPGNILFKDNTALYTPTKDYNPATKKYVDDNIDNLITNINVNLTINLNTGGTQSIPNIIEDDNSQFILLNIIGLEDAGGDHNILIPRYTTSDGNRTYIYYGLLGTDIMNNGNPTNNIYKLYIIGDKTNGLHINISKFINILTESEYSALGETPNTDNVLYFVTPD